MPVQVVLADRRLSASAFLFDKDGTLLSFDHWLAVMRERARRLAGELRLTEEEHRALLRFFGLRPEGGRAEDWGIIPLPRVDAEEATARWLAERGKGTLPALRDLVSRTFRSVDEDFPFERFLQPTPGAGEALRALREAGARTALVTHDTGDAARKHLASLGWDELVDVVVGLDGCGERKPSPTPVLTALRALGVPPWEAVMVGDTATDLQAGRAAGCRLSVGVLTGLGTADELSPHADLLLPDLTGLAVAGGPS